MLRALLLHSVIAWALVRNTTGNILGIGGGAGPATWYPPQPQPFIPPPPRQPVVENPVCLQWGNNVLNPLFPFPLGPIGGGGAVEEEIGGFGCTTYSIRLCPLGSPGSEIVEQEEWSGRGIVEVIDEKFIDESTGRVIAEEREFLDVTNQFYPNYGPYRPSYPYFPPPQPSYPYYPLPPNNIGFQTGASRSLGDE